MNAKDIIKTNFSRYAAYYDNYCGIQDYTGSKLASYTATLRLDSILDIGCGTGNYTRLLRHRFPYSAIKALDISDKMTQIAQQKIKDQQIVFITADAETAALDENFDLITSNACFQWFGDLETTITKYENLLDENGIILFSTFGPLTFYELARSLEKLYKQTHL